MSTETTAAPIKIRRLPITGWGGLCRPCAAERGLFAPGAVWDARDHAHAVQRGLRHLADRHTTEETRR